MSVYKVLLADHPSSLETDLNHWSEKGWRIDRAVSNMLILAMPQPATIPEPPPAPAADSDSIPLAEFHARLEQACAKSMPLTHLVGTKRGLTALDVLLGEATKAAHLPLTEFHLAQETQRANEAVRRQAQLQAEVDALRAQLLTAGLTPVPAPQPEQAEQAQAEKEEPEAEQDAAKATTSADK